MLVKNTAPGHPVCLASGRVLAPGETGDGDPDEDFEQIKAGNLTPVQETQPAPSKSSRRNVQEES